MTHPCDVFEKSGNDKHYIALKNEINDQCKQAKEFVETLWQIAHRFVDPDVLDEIPNQFHTRFWELYLAASLVQVPLPLMESTRRDGPDICILPNGATPRTWVEAVSVSPGTGGDAVPEAPHGVAADVPDEQMKLRLLSAFSEKVRKYHAYREKNWVAASEPYIIALNDGLIPTRYLDIGPPRVVRSLLPIGYEVLHIDTKIMKVVASSREYRPAVTKKSGTAIATTSFLNPEYSGISAVIYSPVDAINRPMDNLAGALLLFHNPLASNPLPRGFLKRGHEYWVESEQLKSKNWHRE
jgi:hypothetical protein